MNLVAHWKTARAWSWLFAVLSWLPVAFWGYENWVLSEFAAQRAREGQFVCGTGMAALFFMCAAAAIAWATLAVVLASFSFARLARPRPRARKWELLLTGSFFAAAAVAYGVLVAVDVVR